jgi:hypothetical protein
MTATVKILRNTETHPRNKVADAELHFVGGELDGLKLIGFAIWKRRDGNGLSVTFPARQFTFHGERRDFALLRAIDDPNAQDRVRSLVLRAYAESEATAAQVGA